MKDYETLYYDMVFKYKNLKKENEYLKQEIELLKKYQKDKDLKYLIIKEVVRKRK